MLEIWGEFKAVSSSLDVVQEVGVIVLIKFLYESYLEVKKFIGAKIVIIKQQTVPIILARK